MKKLYTLFALAGLIAISDMNAMGRFYGASKQAWPYARQVGRSFFTPQNITTPRRSFSWQTMRNLRQKTPTLKSSPFVRWYAPTVLGVGSTLGAAALAKEKELERYLKREEETKRTNWEKRQSTERLKIEKGLTELTDQIHYAEQKLEPLKKKYVKLKSVYDTEKPGWAWSAYTPEERVQMKQDVKELKREIIIKENELEKLNWSLNYSLDYWKQFSPENVYAPLDGTPRTRWAKDFQPLKRSKRR